jgi:mitogen-activated protein kinase kinase 1
MHRDLRPANILCNSDGQVKLTDFATPTEHLDGNGECAIRWDMIGKLKYMAPERIHSQPYNYKADIWSLGLVLIECATGCYPYPETRAHIEMLQTILDAPEPNVDSTYSPEFQEFLGHCLRKDPADRLRADILLASPWLEMNGAINIEAATTFVEEFFREQQSDSGESRYAHK